MLHIGSRPGAVDQVTQVEGRPRQHNHDAGRSCQKQLRGDRQHAAEHDAAQGERDQGRLPGLLCQHAENDEEGHDPQRQGQRRPEAEQQFAAGCPRRDGHSPVQSGRPGWHESGQPGCGRTGRRVSPPLTRLSEFWNPGCKVAGRDSGVWSRLCLAHAATSFALPACPGGWARKALALTFNLSSPKHIRSGRPSVSWQP